MPRCVFEIALEEVALSLCHIGTSDDLAKVGKGVGEYSSRDTGGSAVSTAF